MPFVWRSDRDRLPPGLLRRLAQGNAGRGPRACSKTGCIQKKRGIFGLFMCILVLFLMRPGGRMRRFRYLCKIKFE